MTVVASRVSSVFVILFWLGGRFLFLCSEELGCSPSFVSFGCVLVNVQLGDIGSSCFN